MIISGMCALIATIQGDYDRAENFLFFGLGELFLYMIAVFGYIGSVR